MANRQYKIGLALSGGGARGFAHVGVIMALKRFGITPEIISGVSAGAIVAALYGSGLSAKDIFKCFAEYTRITDYTNLIIPKESLFKFDKFSSMLSEWLPIKNIEDSKIPIVICAADFDNGRSVGWSKGAIVERVIASCSIPIIFPPVVINGVNYVDGGMLRNLPAWAIRRRCKTLYGSNCSPLPRDYRYKSSLVNVAYRSFQLMTKANTLQDLMLCDHIIQSSDLAHYSTFDVAQMKKIAICGYDAACRVLERNSKR